MNMLILGSEVRAAFEMDAVSTVLNSVAFVKQDGLLAPAAYFLATSLPFICLTCIWFVYYILVVIILLNRTICRPTIFRYIYRTKSTLIALLLYSQRTCKFLITHQLLWQFLDLLISRRMLHLNYTFDFFNSLAASRLSNLTFIVNFSLPQFIFLLLLSILFLLLQVWVTLLFFIKIDCEWL